MAVLRNKKTDKLLGVSEEAKKQGVSRGHLSLVIRGKRTSKRLLKKVRVIDVD